MFYRGHVKGGVVVFAEGAGLPEGMEVLIQPAPLTEGSPVEGRTLAEQFADVIGTMPDLPPDMAAKHDHYFHGAPKG
jgi:hypothetical protein